ncbi:related to extracellular cellulase CelA/allergen Asp F7-like, putative [Cephalotrichum gorgonifer]|uniref:Related to extracellular cellulase CelA/allergen Asp F7-like, putative n=1 Tax=Cephalotrichum gorgonifer TaxID=2041049 RepID=A0AAE8N2H1_9PEZI|nr:related to extracellular cellulase CelA/allergen Asp F7-like, putative [Cephalotrichum gorgonifer]
MTKLSPLGLVSALLAFSPSFALAQIRGSATFTGNDHTGGTCSLFNYTLPAGISGTGIGPSNWATGGKCGSCLQVRGPNGSTKVMVVDSCPSCLENRLNLSEDAFVKIADKADGIVDVEFDVVSCGLNSPLIIRNKIGTSRWFFSMQVLNANYPVTDLEVSADDNRTWESTVRQDYNFFEKEDKSGFGKDRVSVRVSCSNGNQVIIPNVSMESEVQIVAPVNC